MRKFFLMVVVMCCSLAVSAQTGKSARKDSIINIMSIEICDEINNKNGLDPKSDDFEFQLGMLLLPTISKYSSDLQDFYESDNLMQDIGEDVGTKLALSCPAFVSLVSGIDGLGVTREIPVVKEIRGRLEKIQHGDFSFLQIKTESGKSEKMWWLEHFPGAEFLEDNKVMGKKISVGYKEMNVYNSKLKDYINIKVVTSLSVE